MTVPSWLDRSAWPWAPHWAPLDAGRLHYIDEGAGPVLLLVHGTPTWSFEWRHVVAGMRDTHRVLALDHLGFGLSDRPTDAGYTPEQHAQRFRYFMDLVYPKGDITLVVHDFGGPIALDWALDHPGRLSRLVIANSWMWSFDDDAAMSRRARMIDGAIGRWLYRRLNASQRLIMPSAYGDRSKLTPAIHRQYLSVFSDADGRDRVLFPLAQSLSRSSAFFESLWQRRDRLAHVPLHLLWGSRDSAFPIYMLERWQRAFPRARTTPFPLAGHWPHEEAPEAFVEALREGVSG